MLERGKKKILAELNATAGQKKKTSNKLKYLAKDVSKQRAEGIARFPLAACSEVGKGRDKLRNKLLSKVEPELDVLENSQPVLLSKGAKACSGENAKDEEDSLCDLWAQ